MKIVGRVRPGVFNQDAVEDYELQDSGGHRTLAIFHQKLKSDTRYSIINTLSSEHHYPQHHHQTLAFINLYTIKHNNQHSHERTFNQPPHLPTLHDQQMH